MLSAVLLALLAAGPTLSELEAKCSQLNADSACAALALRLLANNPEEARRLASGPCARNDRTGCEVMAVLALNARQWDEALTRATFACDDQHGAACYVKGMLAFGEGPRQDLPGAADALEKACRASVVDACSYFYGLAKTLKLEGAQLRRAEAYACQANNHEEACAKVLEQQPVPPGPVLEQALRVLCAKKGEKSTNPKTASVAVSACERLDALAANGAPSVLRALSTECDEGNKSSCDRLAASPASPEQRFSAMKKLCDQENPKWCGALAKELAARTPIDHEALTEALAWACLSENGPECAQLEAAAERLGEGHGPAAELEKACSPRRLSLCRAAEKLRGSLSSDASLVLCGVGELASCARVSEASPLERAWALARQCEARVAGSCAALERLKRPGLKGKVDSELIAAAWVASLATPPSRVPPFECVASEDCRKARVTDEARARVARWFDSLPREATLRAVSDELLCDVLLDLGVPAKELTVPLPYDIYVGTEGAALHVDSQQALPLDETRANVSVCADRWQVRSPSGEELAEGNLDLSEGRLAFEEIKVGERPPVYWLPSGRFWVGAEVLASIPPGGAGFLTETGSVALRFAGINNDPFAFAMRANLILPIGRTPFGLSLDLGGSFGRLMTSRVRWRPLNALIGIWASLTEEDTRLMFTATASTELGLAIDEHELIFELGARLPVTLFGGTASQLPLNVTPAPFVAIGFRPTF